MINFGQWNTTKYDSCRLDKHMHIGASSFGAYILGINAKIKPKQLFGEAHMEDNQGLQPHLNF